MVAMLVVTMATAKKTLVNFMKGSKVVMFYWPLSGSCWN
jgi:hypothetical protein